MSRLEEMACEACNDVLLGRFSPVIPEEIYDGEKNIPIARSVARGLCFLFMHDMYGFSYRNISLRSGFTDRSVMRRVRLTRNALSIGDSLVTPVYEVMRDRIRKCEI